MKKVIYQKNQHGGQMRNRLDFSTVYVFFNFLWQYTKKKNKPHKFRSYKLFGRKNIIPNEGTLIIRDWSLRMLLRNRQTLIPNRNNYVEDLEVVPACLSACGIHHAFWGAFAVAPASTWVLCGCIFLFH
jgi:hypothetical protein